jgi:hypothetical protein
MGHVGSSSRPVRISLLSGTGFDTNLSRTPSAQRCSRAGQMAAM